jgi:hypothetical protein
MNPLTGLKEEWLQNSHVHYQYDFQVGPELKNQTRMIYRPPS